MGNSAVQANFSANEALSQVHQGEDKPRWGRNEARNRVPFRSNKSDTARFGQVGPKLRQDGAKRAQDEAKMSQDESKIRLDGANFVFWTCPLK